MKMMRGGSRNPVTTTYSSNRTDKEEPIIQPPLEYPWLLFKTERGNSGYVICCATSPLYKGFSIKFSHNFIVHNVFNCCYGWLILSNSENKFLLWNPVVSRSIKLAPLHLKPGENICSAVLSSPTGRDLGPNCLVLLFKDTRGGYISESSSVVFCTIGEKRWYSACYPPEIISMCRLKNAIVINGSVFLEDFGNHKLFRINHLGPTSIVVTQYCKLPRVPPDTDAFGCFVESCGELFYVVVTWTGFYQKRLSDLQAYKFDQAKIRWRKVKEIGGRVFFLSRTYSVSSKDATGRNKGGFAYFISASRLYSYNFADNSVSTSLWHSTWNLSESFDQPITYLPDTRMIDGAAGKMNLVESGQYEVDRQKVKEGSENCEIDRDANKEGECRFVRFLSDDAIKVIATFLNPVDYLNFRCICTRCKQLTPQIEWRKGSITLQRNSTSPLSPWLVLSNNPPGVSTFIDSRLGGKYHINTPKSLVHDKIIYSNDGWLLLMSTSLNTLSFYNPFSAEIINQIPELPAPYIRYPNIGFSSSPKSSNCVVVAIASNIIKIEIYIFQVGNEGWDAYRFDYENNMDSSVFRLSSPVFHKGDVFVLCNNGDLGVFKSGSEVSWKTLAMAEETKDILNHNFLVECDGKLLSVSFIVGEVEKSTKVLALNETTMSWEKVDNLGNYTLYLSRASSFSVAAQTSWMKNIIFLPRLHNDEIVYYSMDSGKYQSLVNKKDPVEYDQTRELLFGCWIQPSWA